MSSLSEKSGPWTGQWIQEPLRGAMKCTLRFNGTEITGGGHDNNGSFRMEGNFDPASDDVVLSKSYFDLLVIYRGRWDGTMISGESRIYGSGGFFDTGSFELWPEAEEIAMESLELLLRQPVELTV